MAQGIIGRVRGYLNRRQWAKYHFNSYMNRTWDRMCPLCHNWYRRDRMTASFCLVGTRLEIRCRCGCTAKWNVEQFHATLDSAHAAKAA